MLKSFVILSMLIIALSAQAQSAADRLYMQGQKLQLTRTISAQNQAIGKFSAAKRAYDSREKKALCDRQIQICKQNIKNLDPKPDPKPKPKPTPDPKQKAKEKAKAKQEPKPNPTPKNEPPKVEAISTANGILFKIGNTNFEMVRVEGGTFTMGATSEQGSDAYSVEKPTHQVTLSSYMIGKTEVTQALWEAVMGKSVSQIASENGWSTYGVGSNYPMYDISYEDCKVFISKLNAITGKNFRFPTEAEWEFAARGGNNSRGYKFSGSNTLSNVAWYKDNSSSTTHPVASKAPNELGIYDMSGNVYEWCSDWYGDYSSSSQYNPTGPNSGSYRVIRGGCWYVDAHCRVSYRYGSSPSGCDCILGLRLALSEDGNRDDGPKVEAINTADGILFKIGNTNFEMVRVEGGTFTMGATSEQGSDAESNEKPVHFVTLSSYMIGKTEVTQELWQAVMGSNPSCYKGTNLPVEKVSWDDCQTFIRKLNALTGKNFRLPTETEWEFATRGGNNSQGYKYSGSNTPSNVAWYSDGATHPVASKSPNELGIYDMSGNVYEWCSDWYGDYSSTSQYNPTGPYSGSLRVARGGCCFGNAKHCRVSERNFCDPSQRNINFGLRLALSEDNNRNNDTKPATQTYTRKVETFYANGVSFEMVRVEGGTFTMGATAEQGSDAYFFEKPTHQVTLSSYSIGKTEVTQELWQAVMGSNPSNFKGSNLPVELVTWEDCQTFIRKLNVLTGKNFRLPTEAEWEYAARGGDKSRGYKYSGSNTLSNVAWYDDNSSSTTHPVATKAPNELGIYDMSGNVWEWCSDWYDDYSSSSQYNPTGANSGSGRVFRGGSWIINARYCRVSYRDSDLPTFRGYVLGLRLAL
ncbi:MAG: formylglycine-generating enzyme family protein [Sodaliphilus sp.]